MKRLLLWLGLLLLVVGIYWWLGNRSATVNANPSTSDTSSTSVIDTTANAPTKVFSIEDAALDTTSIQLQAQEIQLGDGTRFSLNIPEGFRMIPAAEGLRRVRFFSKAPDGRLFVTGMHALYDNKKGKIFILDDFDAETGKFKSVIVWKDKLRNPNSIAFYQDKAGKDWIYVALTDKLIRYPFQHGETSPTGASEKIADFPGYGLNYKYGGWHLTRTIAIHEDKLYVSVGSSCNLCEERLDEPSRASIMVMNPDGSDARIFAKGVRNAVDIGWVHNKLYATNMASDHLGNDKPNDYLYQVKDGENYGWPYCYEHEGVIYKENPNDLSDNKVPGAEKKTAWEREPYPCDSVANAYALLEPHGAPLGFEYCDATTASPALRNYFLVALHGSTLAKVGTGHRIVRVKKGHSPQPVIDGFLKGKERVGRPCDIFQWDDHSFFISDDHAGVVYYLSSK